MEKQQRRKAVAAYKAQPPAGRGCSRSATHRNQGRILLRRTLDLRGSENRFQFAQMTGSCTDHALQADLAKRWLGIGFEVLEVLTQKETQTEAEFKSDIEALFELWQESWRTHPRMLEKGNAPPPVCFFQNRFDACGFGKTVRFRVKLLSYFAVRCVKIH